MRPLKGCEVHPHVHHHRSNRTRLSDEHHPDCILCQGRLVDNLHLDFDVRGALVGTFTCDRNHSGYTDRVHGGILAAIIDASMAQCLMGHDIVAYTAELTVRYKVPVKLDIEAEVRTEIEEHPIDRLYRMKTTITQKRSLCVIATATFVTG